MVELDEHPCNNNVDEEEEEQAVNLDYEEDIVID